MNIQLSPRDMNTYKHWLAAIAAVYFTLIAAVILGVSWDVSQRNVSSLQTADHFDNQTRSIATVSYHR
jgi:hypothetical protein